MSKRSASLDRLSIRHFWDVGKEFRKEQYLTLLIPINSLCLYTIAPFLIGKILGSLTRPNSNITALVIWFIVVAAVGIMANRVAFINLLAWQPKVMARLQTESLAMLLRRGTAFHNNRVSGKLVSDALDYPNAYSQLSTAFFATIIPFAVTIVSGLILISYSSLLLGLLMLIMSAMAIGSGIYQRKKMAPFRAIRLKANKDLTSHLADAVVNIQAVKTFAREAYELKQHDLYNDRLRDSRMHDWRILATDGTNRITSLLGFELLFILVTVWLVRRDPSLLAAGIFAFSYTVTLTNRLFDIGTMMRSIEEALLLAEPMTAALQEGEEIVDMPGAAKLSLTEGSIRFDKVNFRYSDSSAQTNIFDNLSMGINPGEKVGLVGPSGGGKSTITRLLLRFEDIQSGSIYIDEQDIAAVTQQSLRQVIAYVPQESLLFHRSVRENIIYGNPGATVRQITLAAKDAYAHEFIMSLPQGYDTVVGERGVKLSGGQRQRIAIARAILKNAPILVLDEATSALDSESEKVIQEALWELMKGRTAVVIAHRLSTIARLDRIVVLSKGKIIEDGSHHDLLAKSGMYADLWQHQSGGFISE